MMDGIIDILPKEDASLANNGTTDCSMEMEKREESEKFGLATLVSISKNKKVRCLDGLDGVISVKEKSRIELSNRKGDLIWYKVIMSEQYNK